MKTRGFPLQGFTIFPRPLSKKAKRENSTFSKPLFYRLSRRGPGGSPLWAAKSGSPRNILIFRVLLGFAVADGDAAGSGGFGRLGLGHGHIQDAVLVIGGDVILIDAL